jgi:hypothetical protein
MGYFDRSRENPTHTVALGTTIVQRPDRWVAANSLATSARGGLKFREHYTTAPR